MEAVDLLARPLAPEGSTDLRFQSRKTPLDLKPSSLYYKVACNMRSLVVRQNQPADVSGRLRLGRMSFEIAWAAIWPPLMAILVALIADVLWENAAHDNSESTTARQLMPLMLGGMAILSALIYFDCRAKEAFRSRADKIRTTQGISTAITMIFLAVAVVAQGDHRQASDTAALVLFLCLPVLFVCAGFLWHAATLIRGSFHRGLILVAFVITTALVELLSLREVHGNAEERLFMLNSLLVALAFAIHLGVWSTRALERR